MVLKETENCNTVGLGYSLRNQDEHSTVIPMSTTLLTQSIPDFEESTVAFPLKSLRHFFLSLLFFPISVLTSLKVHCCSAGEVGDRMLGWLQADCFLSVQ